MLVSADCFRPWRSVSRGVLLGAFLAMIFLQYCQEAGSTAIASAHTCTITSVDRMKALEEFSEGSTTAVAVASSIPRGGGLIPGGYHPFGYGLTDLGRRYLEFDGSLDGDVGRFLASLKSGGRKTRSILKDQWLEVVRVSKKGQAMRILRTLDDLLDFCLKAGFIN